MKKILTLVTITALISISAALAAPGQKLYPHKISGGDAFQVPNIHLSRGSGHLESAKAINMSDHDLGLAKRANTMFSEEMAALSGLLVKKGQIIFERYRHPAGSLSPIHSMSMSKSLTADTIGHLICDGKIKNITDNAKVYAPRLEGTLHG